MEKHQSLLQIIFKQFVSHRLAVVSVSFLILLSAVSLLAPFVCSVLGVDPNSQDILQRYAPPMSHVQISGSEQESRVDSWAHSQSDVSSQLASDAKNFGWVAQSEDNSEVPFVLLEKLNETPAFREELEHSNSESAKEFLQLHESFKSLHVLGTDELGRDVLARIIYGARVSLAVALLVGISSAFIGLLIGALAGYYGGFLDSALMRFTDAMLTIPTLPLYIIFAAIDLRKVPVIGNLIQGENESLIKLVVILTAFAWMRLARLVRGAVMSVKENEYILAARTIGVSHFNIVTSHIVPNIVGPLVVSVTLSMGEAMLVEAGLSFLGLGIQPPMPSWGNMLQNSLELVNAAPLLAVAPGLMIFVVIIAINFLGDGLRDALDPKAIRR